VVDRGGGGPATAAMATVQIRAKQRAGEVEKNERRGPWRKK